MSLINGNVVKSQAIVGSSQLSKAEYLDTGDLLITFTRGTQYVYKGVPEFLYEELLKAESAGKFFNATIKPKFEYFQVLPKGAANP